MSKGCLTRQILSKPVELGIIIVTTIIFLTLGATLGPYRASITIIALLIIYIIIQGQPTSIRLIPLAAAAAAHIGAVTTYYSNPLILPLVILERSITGKYSLNIDIVQLALLYEARYHLKHPPTCPQEAEDSKTPAEYNEEPGEQPR